MKDKKFLASIAIFLAALIIGQLGLHNRTLWYDEAISILEAHFGPHGILQAVKDEGIPPLYNVILSLWQKISDSELWARELSVIFGALSVLLIFLFALEFTTFYKAIAISIIFALFPFHLWHAQEIRMYALVEFFAMASFFSLYRYLEGGKKIKLVLYTIFSIPIFWLHYIAGLAFLAQVIFLAINIKRYKTKALGFLAALALISIAYIPWLPTFFQHLLLRTKFFWTEPLTLSQLWATLGLFAGALKTASPLNRLTPWAFSILFLLATTLLFYLKRRDLALMLWLWFVIPFVSLTLVSLKQNILLDRTILYLLPAFLLLSFWALEEVEKLGLKYAFATGLVILALLSATSTRTYLFNDNWWAKSSTRKLAKMVAQFYKDGDLVVHTSRFSARPFQYYLKDKNIQMCLIKETEDLPKLFELIGRLDCPNANESIKRIWLVGYADFQNPNYHNRALEWYAKNHDLLEVSYFDGYFVTGLFARKVAGPIVPPLDLWAGAN